MNNNVSDLRLERINKTMTMMYIIISTVLEVAYLLEFIKGNRTLSYFLYCV